MLHRRLVIGVIENSVKKKMGRESGRNIGFSEAWRVNNNGGPSSLRNLGSASREDLRRSSSISSAVLQRYNQKKGRQKKRATFSPYQDVISQNESMTSSSRSSDSSSSLSEEEDLDGHRKETLSEKDSGESPGHAEYDKNMGGPLQKTTTYPVGTLKPYKSLDHYTIERGYHNVSPSGLPAFNKRPLTDTPIVSTAPSPQIRSHGGDSETENDDTRVEKYPADVHHRSRSSTLQNHNATESKDTAHGKANNNMPRMRDISHLNLGDLDSRNSHVKGRVNSQVIRNEKGQSDEQTTTKLKLNDQLKELRINNTTKENLLQDVPQEMQEQFEKTPSIEKLKNLLLTKPPPSARKAYTLNIPGQTSSKTSPDGRISSVDVGSKLVIVMVGLPARGKSYITNKLARYLNWLQHDCRVFNVGNTRRKDKEHNAGPEADPLPDTNTPNNESSQQLPQQPDHDKELSTHKADFFSPDNKSSTVLREKWAMDTLDQLLNYVIDGPGSVGIFDATNSTKQRRLKILKKIKQRSANELKVLFLESICSDPSLIESNIRLKLSGPDYREIDSEVALRDFVGRLANYEKAYQTLDESEEETPGFQYVKMIDVGKKVVSYNILGFLASQTVYFLLNFNLCERQIWITRHGESTDNLTGRIGGNSNLTKRGEKFSQALAKFMSYHRAEFRKQQLERFSTRLELRYGQRDGEKPPNVENIPNEPNFCVWTSMLLRSVETAKFFDENLYSVKAMRMLNELGGGKFDGMTYEEIKQKYPQEFDSRIQNKLSYRYPGVGGESYLDVLTRLRPLITEVERTTDHLLIISHRVILRILLAYFLNLDKSSMGELDVPLHTLYCLELKPYGTDYRMYEYDEGLAWFVKVTPEHQKNIKEVGVDYQTRKYSVVPTAPPSSASKPRRLILQQPLRRTSLHNPR